MTYGITFGAAAIPEPERHWLEAVEQLPIDAVWQGGHVLPPSATGEAITRLSLMTAWTSRVRVGAAVLVLPLYHPVMAAKQLADLDARSGGRLTVGVGVGGEFSAEFEALGIPVPERGARTDESIEVMRALWSGEPVTREGRFFPLNNARLRPVALPGSSGRVGGPPLVISGRKEAAMRRAARAGDGWLPYLFSPDAYARSVATITAEADLIGRDLAEFEWCAYVYCSVRSSAERAQGDVRSFLGKAYGDKPQEMLDRIAPSGTPEQVAGMLQKYVDAGARHIVISPAAHEDTLEIITLAAQEVLPRLALPMAQSVG